MLTYISLFLPFYILQMLSCPVISEVSSLASVELTTSGYLVHHAHVTIHEGCLMSCHK